MGYELLKSVGWDFTRILLQVPQSQSYVHKLRSFPVGIIIVFNFLERQVTFNDTLKMFLLLLLVKVRLVNIEDFLGDISLVDGYAIKDVKKLRICFLSPQQSLLEINTDEIKSNTFINGETLLIEDSFHSKDSFLDSKGIDILRGHTDDPYGVW